MLSVLTSLPAQELSLEDAVNLALEHNLDIRRAGIDLASAGYSERNLWSEIFPTINVSAQANIGSPLFSNDFNFTGGIERVNVGISLGLNAGIPFAMRSIRLAYEANLLSYENARNQLSIQITKRYFSLVAEKNNILLLEEIYNLAQRQYDRNQISFRNGLISELALTQTRLAADNARFNLSAASISHNNNMSEFLALLGIEEETRSLTLLEEINITRIQADAEQLIAQYLPQRPDIVRLRHEIERLRLAERRAFYQNRAPSLNLSLGWSSTNFDPFTDRLSGSATLSIPVDPWIPGTSRNQDSRRANDAVEKAMLDLTIAENSAVHQIRSLTSRLYNSWESILIARLSYEASQRNYQLTERGFNNGTVEFLVLQDARNNMAGSRQRVLQSELDYFNMILDLSIALNIDWKNLIESYGVASE